MTPDIITKLVRIDTKIITVRIIATRSASLSVEPDLAPSALHHNFHISDPLIGWP